MSEPFPRDLWPDAETLAAGDEDKVSPGGLPIRNAKAWQQERPFQEDGHLAADAAYRAEPPDADG